VGRITSVGALLAAFQSLEVGVISFKDRRRIKEEETLRSAAMSKRRWWRSFTFSGVLSTIALLISCLTAYYNFFYVNHSLSAVIAPFDTPIADPDKGMFLHPVFSNTGNRTEVILRVEAHVYRPECAMAYSGSSAGPFVLKPGDSVVASVAFDLHGLGRKFNLVDGSLYLEIMAVLPIRKISISHRADEFHPDRPKSTDDRQLREHGRGPERDY
jgi:hypothetical protein